MTPNRNSPTSCRETSVAGHLEHLGENCATCTSSRVSHAAEPTQLGGNFLPQLGACIGIALVLATALTDLPIRLVLAIVEALQ